MSPSRSGEPVQGQVSGGGETLEGLVTYLSNKYFLSTEITTFLGSEHSAMNDRKQVLPSCCHRSEVKRISAWLPGGMCQSEQDWWDRMGAAEQNSKQVGLGREYLRQALRSPY